MRYNDGVNGIERRSPKTPELTTQPMTNKELTLHLVNLLQTHRDSISDDDWDAMVGSPLMDALDAITDLEWEVEENGYQGENEE